MKPNLLSAQKCTNIFGFSSYFDCQVHSPLWTGALVIDAEKRKGKSNNDEEEGNRKGKHHPSSHEEGQRRRFAENLSHPVEQQVYSIAQALFKEGNYMVVIAFATWEELASNCLGPGPDADDLSKLMDVSGGGGGGVLNDGLLYTVEPTPWIWICCLLGTGKYISSNLYVRSVCQASCTLSCCSILFFYSFMVEEEQLVSPPLFHFVYTCGRSYADVLLYRLEVESVSFSADPFSAR